MPRDDVDPLSRRERGLVTALKATLRFVPVEQRYSEPVLRSVQLLLKNISHYDGFDEEEEEEPEVENVISMDVWLQRKEWPHG